MPEGDKVCQHHEALCTNIQHMVDAQKESKDTLVKVNTALGDGKVNFKDLTVRLSLVEKLVYGAVAIILAGFLTAVVALVITIVR